MRLVFSNEMRLERGPDGVVHCPTGQLAYEAKTLSALREGFEEVQVFARVFDGRRGTGGPVAGPGVTVFEVPPMSGVAGAVRHAPGLLRAALAAAGGADVAFCRVPGALGSVLARAAWLRGVPTALQVVGDPALVNGGQEGANPWIPRAMAADLRWLCQHTAAANYVTEAYLQRHYPPGPQTRELGLSDVDLGPEDYADAPRRWSGRGPLNLVSVAHLSHPYKGIEVLVRAVAALEGRLDVRLRVVGGGRLQGQYAQLAEELGVGARITWVGTVAAGAGVRAELDRADLLVMPSYTEGLPRGLVEGMARGLPAVGTRVGGIPELIDAAVLVEPGDARGLADRIAAVADPERMAVLAADNLTRARDFAREVLVPRRRAFTRMLRELGR